LAFIEYILPGDMQALSTGYGRLSCITNERGGVIDDCVAFREKNGIFMVINAGCVEKDLEHIQFWGQNFRNRGKDVTIQIDRRYALIALQGPKAAETLQTQIAEDVSQFDFMTTRLCKVAGVPCRVSRCGYTGEDGFEIAIPANEAIALTTKLLAEPYVLMAGLAARDSLRLEAGMNLYGSDLNEDISPMEGGMGWTIGKRRRQEGGFLGFASMQSQFEKGGLSRQRVGLILEKGPPAREGSPLFVGEEQVGIITSGAPSPSLKKNVALATVTTGFHTPGTVLEAEVRGKRYPMVVHKTPFVPTHYYKKPSGG
jgi:aminomethyltransferase